MNQESVKPRNPYYNITMRRKFTYLSTKACPNLRSFLLFQDMACIVIMSPRPVKIYFVNTRTVQIYTLCKYGKYLQATSEQKNWMVPCDFSASFFLRKRGYAKISPQNIFKAVRRIPWRHTAISNPSSSSLLLDFLDESFAAAHCDAPHSPLPETYTTFIFF